MASLQVNVITLTGRDSAEYPTALLGVNLGSGFMYGFPEGQYEHFY